MMDEELVLIFGFIIVVTTILGITVNGIVAKVLDYKRSQAGIAATGERPVNVPQELNDRTEMIEDRLHVLERIATDRGQLLSDEIEALRKEALPQPKTEERA